MESKKMIQPNIRFVYFFLLVPFCFVLACILCIGCGRNVIASGQNNRDVVVESLRCEYLSDPEGIDVQVPRLSWVINSAERGVKQSGYQILVASDKLILQKDAGDLWDSGKVVSDQSVQVEYDGAKLRSYQDCYWKVRIWDGGGKASKWSEPAYWSMGIIEPAGWKAKWIQQQNPAPATAEKDELVKSIYPLPIFRKGFKIQSGIQDAKVYVCGLGQYELYLNGEKVGERFLDPAWSVYEETVYYNAFDITDSIKEGENVFGVMLGKGFYNTKGDRRIHFVDAYRPLKLILQARIMYEDGSSVTVVSDGSWKFTDGPITQSAILGGSSYDGRCLPEGWCSTDFDDNDWISAEETFGPGGQLKAFAAEPMKVQGTFEAISVDEPESGYFVYDFGQNAAFIPCLTLEGKAGQTVRLTPAEQRHGQSKNANDGKGRVDQARVGKPNYWEYTLKGEGEETWSPQFCYTGFQYLEVSGAVPSGMYSPEGLPAIKKITAKQVRNDSTMVGTFECSKKMFNDIYNIIDWSVQSNMSHVFTDCPHREKLGWLEQSFLMGPSVLWGYDVGAYYTKIITDIKDSQGEDGIIYTVAPHYPDFGKYEIFNYSPEWGAAGVYLPWQLYQWYGDRRILEQSYPMMKGFVDYMKASSDDLIARTGLGDWYDYGHGKGSGYAQFTPDTLPSTAIFYGCADVVTQTAVLLGNKDDQVKYKLLCDNIKAKFNKEFFNGKDAYLNNGSPQTANAMALVLGLVPEEYKSAVLESIVADLKKREYQHTSGDVGFYYLVQALSDNSLFDVLYQMASRDSVGSYGYAVKQGWTSMPEAWDAATTSSMNHCMLGHIQQWFQQCLVGIRPDNSAVGFKKCIICPEVVGDLNWCKGSHVSPYGTIKSEWKIEDSRFVLDVTIPANTSGTVYIPCGDSSKVLEGSNNAVDSEGIHFSRMEDGKAIFEVESGSYNFTVPYTK